MYLCMCTHQAVATQPEDMTKLPVPASMSYCMQQLLCCYHQKRAQDNVFPDFCTATTYNLACKS